MDTALDTALDMDKSSGTSVHRMNALLRRFGELDAALQALILRHMFALRRAERRTAAYRARRLGFRYAGYVSEALEHELYDAVERWWTNRNHAVRSRVREPLPAIEHRLHACLRALVGEAFRPDGADELNLGPDAWHAVVGSLHFVGPIRAGGVGDHWLDQLNARSADGLHHVTVRTLAGARESDDFSDSEHDSGHDDSDAEPRVLRVIYGGPQRFATYEELGSQHGGRVDQVLVVV
jgi:hypothetical protein